jgi:hypothetical protein
VKKVIAAMTVGKDVSMLFAHVVNCMQTEDLELKKLVYLYLINYAKTQPDLAIMAVNTFVKVRRRALGGRGGGVACCAAAAWRGVLVPAPWGDTCLLLLAGSCRCSPHPCHQRTCLPRPAACAQDSQDPNPLIRALAVRTMGCIRVDKITEYLCDPLQRCLKV